jgi:hypothetical protein
MEFLKGRGRAVIFLPYIQIICGSIVNRGGDDGRTLAAGGGWLAEPGAVGRSLSDMGLPGWGPAGQFVQGAGRFTEVGDLLAG